MHLKQQKTMVLNKVLNEKLVNSKCLINCFLLPKIRPKLYRLGELLGKSAMLLDLRLHKGFETIHEYYFYTSKL